MPFPLAYERFGPDGIRAKADGLLAAYADAYGVDPGDGKAAAFGSRLERALGRPGFEAAVASGPDGAVGGFAFGYPLPEGDARWWAGLRPEPAAGFAVETGARTFVLAEIEVRRAFQGTGTGRRLHDLLLGGRAEERATLAVNPAADAAHAIYRRWGWESAGQVPGSSGDWFDAYDLFVVPLPIAAVGR
ncbi:MAG: hypothetical protein ACRDOI_09695 [Trebonia sp.]